MKRLLMLTMLAFVTTAGIASALPSDERGFKDYRCIGRILAHGESRLLFDLAVPLRHGQYGEFMGQRITVDFAGRVSTEIDDQRDKLLSPLGPLPEGVNYVVFAKPGADFSKDTFVPRIVARKRMPNDLARPVGDATGKNDSYVEATVGETRVECIRTASPEIARMRR